MSTTSRLAGVMMSLDEVTELSQFKSNSVLVPNAEREWNGYISTLGFTVRFCNMDPSLKEFPRTIKMVEELQMG